jgi:hypothetical protein
MLAMQVEEIDLRYVPEGCTSHPAIKLRGFIQNVAERRVEKIKLFFKEEDIPRGIMEFVLRSYGYVVEGEQRLEDGSLVLTAVRRP